MSRSIKKGPYVHETLLKKIDAMNAADEKKVVKTWSRSSTILPNFVGHTIAVHDGRKHIPVYVTDTAGLRETDSSVEKIGIERARARANLSTGYKCFSG